MVPTAKKTKWFLFNFCFYRPNPEILAQYQIHDARYPRYFVAKHKSEKLNKNKSLRKKEINFKFCRRK